MSADALRLLLVGCGKMGGALLQRTADSESWSSAVLTVVDPAPAPSHLKSLRGLTWVDKLEKLDPAFHPNIVVLAVKPQHMADILPAYGHFDDCVFLSIAAGITLTKLGALLGNPNAAIVRTMPNLPAVVGEGMTSAIANAKTTPAQRALCEKFLKSVGDIVWMDDEGLMDVVTGLSGSGPAYVFALCEAMAQAGEILGLSRDVAARLARQTVIGSGALLARSNEAAETLRCNVTSPGGTTEAALTQLMAENGLQDLLLRTVTAATKRAKELAQ